MGRPVYSNLNFQPLRPPDPVFGGEWFFCVDDDVMGGRWACGGRGGMTKLGKCDGRVIIILLQVHLCGQGTRGSQQTSAGQDRVCYICNVHSRVENASLITTNETSKGSTL
jgi:hypothetical protein